MKRKVRAQQDLLLPGGLAIVVVTLTSCASPVDSKATQQAPQTSVTETEESLQTLSLRGLPLLLTGWNGTYRKASFSKNGKPVWERPEHWYGGLFALRIIGVTIWFDGEAWVLHRDGDPETLFMARSSHGGDSPVGDWDGGYVKVTPFRPSKEEDTSLPLDHQRR